MANTKEEIRKILDALPDDAAWEDVRYSIYVREHVERGKAEADEGKLLDQEQVESRMKRWLRRVAWTDSACGTGIGG